ncbi:MAG: hypothetical protein ACKERG_02620 [Candidatus Hodgkinia cicadicola]
MNKRSRLSLSRSAVETTDVGMLQMVYIVVCIGYMYGGGLADCEWRMCDKLRLSRVKDWCVRWLC